MDLGPKKYTSWIEVPCPTPDQRPMVFTLLRLLQKDIRVTHNKLLWTVIKLPVETVQQN